jgi:protein phosphatase
MIGSTMVTGEVLAGGARYAGRSLAGGRAHNEDGFVCEPRIALFAVADGMGGHNAGEVASALALETLTGALRDRLARGVTPADALLGAFWAANRHVFEAARRHKEQAGMGCTLSAVLLAPPFLVGAHVGDSRVVRQQGSSLSRLTKDHSLPEAPHIVTRAIGTKNTVKVDSFTTRIEPDDAFLLCTDGVSNVLPDHLVARLLVSARHAPPATAVDGILRAASRNATDNLTAVVLRIEARS